MDRLSALAIVAALVACDDAKQAGDPPSRVNAAKVEAKQGATTEAFCDVHFAAEKAPAFQWPPIKDAPGAASGWRWINVWATWCKPCIEEMPRLVKWRDKLTAAGKTVELAFISIDESDADVAAYRKDHADAPPTLRLADAKARTAWFKATGLDGDPPIPVHIFVDAKGHTRCARAGGVREQDWGVVEKLLGE
jgi:thiol-disulfide isomerase/thioredoxin